MREGINKYMSEGIGTFGLVFFGTGAMIIDDLFAGVITHAGIALAFGLVVMAMIYAFGETSGAHINPAVTIGFWLTRRFPGKDVLPYLLAQFSGAILASLLLRLMFPPLVDYGMTQPSSTVILAFGLEVIMSFFLMMVILNVSTGSKEVGTMAGIAVGGIIFLEALVGGPVSGASMNPARSLAPALVSRELSDIWLYMTAPVVGCALAVLGCRITKKGDCC